MSELNKPSTPVVVGTTVSTDTVPGAVQYALYKVRYVYAEDAVQPYVLADGRVFATNDGETFMVRET